MMIEANDGTKYELDVFSGGGLLWLIIKNALYPVWREIRDGRVDWSQEELTDMTITPPEIRHAADRMIRNLAFT